MASVAGVAATHRRRRLGDVVPVSMASAAGVAGRVIPGVAMLNNIVSMASAADVAATLPFGLSRSDSCLNGLCGRCRCDTREDQFKERGKKVSMASAADVAATKVAVAMKVDVLSQWPLRPMSLRPTMSPRGRFTQGLNGLCGRCRCDSGRIFPMAGKHLQPPVQEPPGARGCSGPNGRKIAC